MKEEKLLLKNGIVYTTDKDARIKRLDKNPADIRIFNGTISDINKNLPARPDEKIIDLTGLTILPGLVDLHAHLRDFDQANLEDFDTGTKAAAAGGFTTVVAMANTNPPRDNIDILKDTISRIKTNACIEVLPVAAVTQGLAGEVLTDIEILAQNGAVAFSDDGMPIMNMAILRQALIQANSANSFIICHSEDKHLSAGGSMNESQQSKQLHLGGIPTASEAAAVAREVEVLRYQGGHLHFTHLSTTAAINIIRRAKTDGLWVTADVTPHHLTLIDEDIISPDANFKMNPPLRSGKDQKAIFDAIVDGTIDAIATDHAPHSPADKRRPFEQCPFGVLGFETAFSLAYEKLVQPKLISFERLIEMLTVNPARILRLSVPLIAPGQPANLAIVDLNKKWEYNVNNSHSKSRNSPFHGRKLTSKNLFTLYKGKLVFQDEEAISRIGK